MKGVANDLDKKRQTMKNTLVEKYKYRIGEKYGYLEIVDVVCGERRTLYVCKCHNCGKTVKKNYYDLTSGKVISCGCYHSEKVSEYASTHTPKNKYGYEWYYIYNNQKIVCDSSYEVLYANYLIESGINFTYHQDIITLPDKHRYIPDFYIVDTDTYIEIKASHWYKSNLYKSYECADMNYNIIILDYNDIRDLANIPYACSSGIIRAAKKTNTRVEDYFANKMYLKQLSRNK